MDKKLDYTKRKITNPEIQITGSKSESNRLLILQQWYFNLDLSNLSNSDDTQHLQKALNSKKKIINIGHAGTAMRFLTAYFSTLEAREVTLTGSSRMQNRPIQVLVDAMRSLGAKIDYLDKQGYPPIQITGKKLRASKVAINGNVSSQYISALLLIAPVLEQGLEIELLQEVTSKPYLEMTLGLLKQLGIQTSWEENKIKIKPKATIEPTNIRVESDWSSASYFYSFVALSELGTSITLSSYKKNSLQGDSILASIYTSFGVETIFLNNKITISKTTLNTKPIKYNLKDAPDIAQTIAVSSFGLGIACNLTGLHTLKIKETDRLIALQNELTKLGATIEVTENSLALKVSTVIKSNINIETYQDHRMAMAFAPLALKTPIRIIDADVVSKSFPSFWEDLEACFKK